MLTRQVECDVHLCGHAINALYREVHFAGIGLDVNGPNFCRLTKAVGHHRLGHPR